jgi:hypothetical protein
MKIHLLAPVSEGLVVEVRAQRQASKDNPLNRFNAVLNEWILTVQYRAMAVRSGSERVGRPALIFGPLRKRFALEADAPNHCLKCEA